MAVSWQPINILTDRFLFFHHGSYLKGFRTSLSLAENRVVGKSKNRRRTADGFKIFLFRLQIIFKFNKTGKLRGKNRTCLTSVETGWALNQGFSLFPIAWRPGGKCTHLVYTFVWAFPLLCKHC